MIKDLKDKNVHVSFDFDSMNPNIFPAVSVPAKNGFTVEEVNIIFDSIFNNLKVISWDFVEYNYAKDKDGKCLEIVKDFINKVTKNIK